MWLNEVFIILWITEIKPEECIVKTRTSFLAVICPCERRMLNFILQNVKLGCRSAMSLTPLDTHHAVRTQLCSDMSWWALLSHWNQYRVSATDEKRAGNSFYISTIGVLINFYRTNELKEKREKEHLKSREGDRTGAAWSFGAEILPFLICWAWDPGPATSYCQALVSSSLKQG